jgi:hypothetical protein
MMMMLRYGSVCVAVSASLSTIDPCMQCLLCIIVAHVYDDDLVVVSSFVVAAFVVFY